MVCTYYEDSVFYVSTDAKKNKMLQIEKNNEVSVGGLGWYAFQGTAENLGWVKDEKNVEIRAKFKRIFDWFDEVGDEDNPNSIVLRISLTEGTITDNEKNTVNGSMKLILSIKRRNKFVKNKQFLTCLKYNI